MLKDVLCSKKKSASQPQERNQCPFTLRLARKLPDMPVLRFLKHSTTFIIIKDVLTLKRGRRTPRENGLPRLLWDRVTPALRISNFEM